MSLYAANVSSVPAIFNMLDDQRLQESDAVMIQNYLRFPMDSVRVIDRARMMEERRRRRMREGSGLYIQSIDSRLVNLFAEQRHD